MDEFDKSAVSLIVKISIRDLFSADRFQYKEHVPSTYASCKFFLVECHIRRWFHNNFKFR